MAGPINRARSDPRLQAAMSENAALRSRLSHLHKQARQGMHARIDAAQTTTANQKHWAFSDFLGPNSEMDPAARFILRNRGRYEGLNNSYCRGLIRSLAYDLIGTGPRLQLSIPKGDNGEDNAPAAKAIERAYAKWCRAIKLGRKLRIMEKSCARDGESFGLLVHNPRIDNPIKLDVRLVEADQCQTPIVILNNPYVVEGIKFDENWEPIEYYFSKFHPGETQTAGLNISPMSYVTIPADLVLHWYEQDRAGQMRGIPKITAALPLFSQLRRWTLASLTAAEFAAMVAGVMKTTLPPGDANPVQVDQYDLIELVRGALLTLPEGWEATQMKAEQPTTQYGDFKRELLNECGRGPGAPLNVVTGNSSGYNYSSGRLDHLPYHRGLRVDREDLRDLVLDRVLEAWYDEAMLLPPAAAIIPAGVPDYSEWSCTWNYDGFDSIDQNKDATADDTRIKNGTSTYAEILAEYGQDWNEHLDQLAREKAECEARGLPWPIIAPATRIVGQPGPDQPGEDTSPAPPMPVKPDALAAALDEAGLNENQIDEVVALVFGIPRPIAARFRPHKNGNGHHAGGRK